MDEERSAMIGGIIFILIALGIAGYFGYDYYQEWSLSNTYGATIARMCVTPGGGTPNLANAPRVQKPWTAVVIDGEKKHKWHDILPDDARGDDQASTDVVVCMADSGKSTVQDCYYQGGGGGYFSIPRKQRYQDVVVFNASNGQRVADLRVWGRAPRGCPDMYVGFEGEDIEGPDPTERDFYYTIMGLLWP